MASNVSQVDLLVDLYNHFTILNETVGKGKSPRDLEDKIVTISNIYKKLDEQKKLELHTTGGCLHRIPDKVWSYFGYGALFSGFVASIGQFVAASMTAQAQNSSSCKLSDTIMGINIGSGSLALFGTFYVLLYTQMDKGRQLKIAAQEKSYNEAKSIFMFLTTLDALKNEKASTPEIKKCIKELDNIPEGSRVRPDKDLWISAMIKILPPESKLRKKFEKQYELAKELREAESNKLLPIHKSSSSGKLEILNEQGTDKLSPDYTSQEKPSKLKRKYMKSFDKINSELGVSLGKIYYNNLSFSSEGSVNEIQKSRKQYGEALKV